MAELFTDYWRKDHCWKLINTDTKHLTNEKNKTHWNIKLSEHRFRTESHPNGQICLSQKGRKFIVVLCIIIWVFLPFTKLQSLLQSMKVLNNLKTDLKADSFVQIWLNEIRELSNIEYWNYVKTNSNPADMLTKFSTD